MLDYRSLLRFSIIGTALREVTTHVKQAVDILQRGINVVVCFVGRQVAEVTFETITQAWQGQHKSFHYPSQATENM